MTLAQVVQMAKTWTSKWMKTKGGVFPQFAWQSGYGGFSVSPGDVPNCTQHIQSQEENHRKASFQEELRALLKEAGIAFDERYVWE